MRLGKYLIELLNMLPHLTQFQATYLLLTQMIAIVILQVILKYVLHRFMLHLEQNHLQSVPHYGEKLQWGHIRIKYLKIQFHFLVGPPAKSYRTDINLYYPLYHSIIKNYSSEWGKDTNKKNEAFKDNEYPGNRPRNEI